MLPERHEGVRAPNSHRPMLSTLDLIDPMDRGLNLQLSFVRHQL
jgi:hypothetical protein